MFKQLILFPTSLLFLVFVAVGCGGEKTKETVIVQSEPDNPNPNPIPNPGPGDPGCKSGYTTAFTDIKSILTETCVGCHSGYDTYKVASEPGKFSVYMNRINLGAADTKRMPKFPNRELSVAEKQKLAQFAADGYQAQPQCRDGAGGEIGNNIMMDLPWIERSLTSNLDSLNNAQAELDTRWVIVSHKSLAGGRVQQMVEYVKGVNKAVNSISRDDDILLTSPVDVGSTLMRIDLEALEIPRSVWELIANNDPFQFVSNTRRGQELRRRTESSTPWMHADNFVNIAFGDPAIYNEIQQIPNNLNDLINDLDIDLNRAFENPFEARLMCFNGSRISNQKNRLLLRLPQENTNGGFWITFDTNALFEDDKNCFDFPLIVVGEAQFNFDASEVIFEKDNGLQAFALFNNQGVREDAAPADVVRNTDNPFSAIIQNGLDCSRCHNGGIIPAVDQARDPFLRTGSQRNPDDVDLVRVLFARNDANQQLIASDNRQVSEAYREMDIRIDDVDQLNLLTDDFRRDWTLQDVAGFMATMGFVEAGISAEDDFCNKLQSLSANGEAQLGQLCESQFTTVTFFQFQDTFGRFLFRDFRLGLDPIEQ